MLTLCGYGATTAQTARTLKSLFNHSGAYPAQLTVPGSGVGSLLSITGDASIRPTAETMSTEQQRVDETERESSQLNQNSGKVWVQACVISFQTFQTEDENSTFLYLLSSFS